MIEFQPKRQFRRHEAITRELASVLASDNFHFALVFALGTFVTRAMPDKTQLQAIHGFIDTLLNLPFEEQSLPTIPVRTLDHGALAPRQPPK